MKIIIEQPVIIQVEEKYTWARFEALKKEFKSAKNISEREGKEGFIIQFNGWEEYKDVFLNLEKRIKKAIEAGDEKDKDYDKKREELAKSFVPIKRVDVFSVRESTINRVKEMDSIIDNYLSMHKKYLDKKSFSLSATYGDDANQLIRFRNCLAECRVSNAMRIAGRMDTACRDAIPSDIYDYVYGSEIRKIGKE